MENYIPWDQDKYNDIFNKITDLIKKTQELETKIQKQEDSDLTKFDKYGADITHYKRMSQKPNIKKTSDYKNNAFYLDTEFADGLMVQVAMSGLDKGKGWMVDYGSLEANVAAALRLANLRDQKTNEYVTAAKQLRSMLFGSNFSAQGDLTAEQLKGPIAKLQDDGLYKPLTQILQATVDSLSTSTNSFISAFNAPADAKVLALSTKFLSEIGSITEKDSKTAQSNAEQIIDKMSDAFYSIINEFGQKKVGELKNLYMRPSTTDKYTYGSVGLLKQETLASLLGIATNEAHTASSDIGTLQQIMESEEIFKVLKSLDKALGEVWKKENGENAAITVTQIDRDTKEEYTTFTDAYKNIVGQFVDQLIQKRNDESKKQGKKPSEIKIDTQFLKDFADTFRYNEEPSIIKQDSMQASISRRIQDDLKKRSPKHEKSFTGEYSVAAIANRLGINKSGGYTSIALTGEGVGYMPNRKSYVEDSVAGQIEQIQRLVNSYGGKLTYEVSQGKVNFSVFPETSSAKTPKDGYQFSIALDNEDTGTIVNGGIAISSPIILNKSKSGIVARSLPEQGIHNVLRRLDSAFKEDRNLSTLKKGSLKYSVEQAEKNVPVSPSKSMLYTSTGEPVDEVDKILIKKGTKGPAQTTVSSGLLMTKALARYYHDNAGIHTLKDKDGKVISNLSYYDDRLSDYDRMQYDADFNMVFQSILLGVEDLLKDSSPDNNTIQTLLGNNFFVKDVTKLRDAGIVPDISGIKFQGFLKGLVSTGSAALITPGTTFHNPSDRAPTQVLNYIRRAPLSLINEVLNNKKNPLNEENFRTNIFAREGGFSRDVDYSTNEWENFLGAKMTDAQLNKIIQEKKILGKLPGIDLNDAILLKQSAANRLMGYKQVTQDLEENNNQNITQFLEFLYQNKLIRTEPTEIQKEIDRVLNTGSKFIQDFENPKPITKQLAKKAQKFGLSLSEGDILRSFFLSSKHSGGYSIDKLTKVETGTKIGGLLGERLTARVIPDEVWEDAFGTIEALKEVEFITQGKSLETKRFGSAFMGRINDIVTRYRAAHAEEEKNEDAIKNAFENSGKFLKRIFSYDKDKKMFIDTSRYDSKIGDYVVKGENGEEKLLFDGKNPKDKEKQFINLIKSIDEFGDKLLKGDYRPLSDEYDEGIWRYAQGLNILDDASYFDPVGGGGSEAIARNGRVRLDDKGANALHRVNQAFRKRVLNNVKGITDPIYNAFVAREDMAANAQNSIKTKAQKQIKEEQLALLAAHGDQNAKDQFGRPFDIVTDEVYNKASEADRLYLIKASEINTDYAESFGTNGQLPQDVYKDTLEGIIKRRIAKLKAEKVKVPTAVRMFNNELTNISNLRLKTGLKTPYTNFSKVSDVYIPLSIGGNSISSSKEKGGASSGEVNSLTKKIINLLKSGSYTNEEAEDVIKEVLGSMSQTVSDRHSAFQDKAIHSYLGNSKYTYAVGNSNTKSMTSKGGELFINVGEKALRGMIAPIKQQKKEDLASYIKQMAWAYKASTNLKNNRAKEDFAKLQKAGIFNEQGDFNLDILQNEPGNLLKTGDVLTNAFIKGIKGKYTNLYADLLRWPVINSYDHQRALVRIHEKLGNNTIEVPDILSFLMKMDYDGDKPLFALPQLYERTKNFEEAQQTQKILHGQSKLNTKIAKRAAEFRDTANKQQPDFEKDLSSTASEVSKPRMAMFTALYSKYMAGKIGQMSNLNTATRNIVDALGWNIGGKSKDKEQLWGAIGSAFTELLEQSPISSKNVFERIGEGNGVDIQEISNLYQAALGADWGKVLDISEKIGLIKSSKHKSGKTGASAFELSEQLQKNLARLEVLENEELKNYIKKGLINLPKDGKGDFFVSKELISQSLKGITDAVQATGIKDLWEHQIYGHISNEALEKTLKGITQGYTVNLVGKNLEFPEFESLEVLEDGFDVINHIYTGKDNSGTEYKSIPKGSSSSLASSYKDLLHNNGYNSKVLNKTNQTSPIKEEEEKGKEPFHNNYIGDFSFASSRGSYFHKLMEIAGKLNIDSVNEAIASGEVSTQDREELNRFGSQAPGKVKQKIASYANQALKVMRQIEKNDFSDEGYSFVKNLFETSNMGRFIGKNGQKDYVLPGTADNFMIGYNPSSKTWLIEQTDYKTTTDNSDITMQSRFLQTDINNALIGKRLAADYEKYAQFLKNPSNNSEITEATISGFKHSLLGKIFGSDNDKIELNNVFGDTNAKKLTTVKSAIAGFLGQESFKNAKFKGKVLNNILSINPNTGEIYRTYQGASNADIALRHAYRVAASSDVLTQLGFSPEDFKDFKFTEGEIKEISGKTKKDMPKAIQEDPGEYGEKFLERYQQLLDLQVERDELLAQIEAEYVPTPDGQVTFTAKSLPTMLKKIAKVTDIKSKIESSRERLVQDAAWLGVTADSKGNLSLSQESGLNKDFLDRFNKIKKTPLDKKAHTSKAEDKFLKASGKAKKRVQDNYKDLQEILAKLTEVRSEKISTDPSLKQFKTLEDKEKQLSGNAQSLLEAIEKDKEIMGQKDLEDAQKFMASLDEGASKDSQLKAENAYLKLKGFTFSGRKSTKSGIEQQILDLEKDLIGLDKDSKKYSGTKKTLDKLYRVKEGLELTIKENLGRLNPTDSEDTQKFMKKIDEKAGGEALKQVEKDYRAYREALDLLQGYKDEQNNFQSSETFFENEAGHTIMQEHIDSTQNMVNQLEYSLIESAKLMTPEQLEERKDIIKKIDQDISKGSLKSFNETYNSYLENTKKIDDLTAKMAGLKAGSKDYNGIAEEREGLRQAVKADESSMQQYYNNMTEEDAAIAKKNMEGAQKGNSREALKNYIDTYKKYSDTKAEFGRIVADMSGMEADSGDYKIAAEKRDGYIQEMKSQIAAMKINQNNMNEDDAAKAEEQAKEIDRTESAKALDHYMDTYKKYSDAKAKLNDITAEMEGMDANSKEYQDKEAEKEAAIKEMRRQKAFLEADEDRMTIDDKRKAEDKARGVDKESSAAVLEKTNAAYKEYTNTMNDLRRVQGQMAHLDSSSKKYKTLEEEQEFLSAKARGLRGTIQGNMEFMTYEDQQRYYATSRETDKGNEGAIKETMGVNAVRTSLLSNFASSFQSTLSYILNRSLAYAIIGQIKKIFATLIQTTSQLNSVMVNLQIASGQSKEKTHNLVKEYTVLAKELGRTTTELAQASNDWLRAGYRGKEVAQLTKASMQLSTLGMIEAKDATTYLISTLKGWKLSAEEVSRVVDKLTTIDMMAAISAGELANAMSYANNAARLAGVDQDQYIGMITTVKDTTQKSAETVGTAFKTMFSRFGNIKAGKYASSIEEISMEEGSSEDEFTKLNDIEVVLGTTGISLRTSPTDWRDTQDVMADIGENWKTWDKTTQNAVATAIGGTRQREMVVSLFENWEDVAHYAEAAKDSYGTAAEKMEIYSDSIEAAKKRLTVSTEKLSLEIEQSGVIKEFYNMIGTIVNLLSHWKESLAVIGTLLLAFKGGTIAKGLGTLLPRLSYVFGGGMTSAISNSFSGYKATFGKGGLIGTGLHSAAVAKAQDRYVAQLLKNTSGLKGEDIITYSSIAAKRQSLSAQEKNRLAEAAKINANWMEIDSSLETLSTDSKLNIARAILTDEEYKNAEAALTTHEARTAETRASAILQKAEEKMAMQLNDKSAKKAWASMYGLGSENTGNIKPESNAIMGVKGAAGMLGMFTGGYAGGEIGEKIGGEGGKGTGQMIGSMAGMGGTMALGSIGGIWGAILSAVLALGMAGIGALVGRENKKKEEERKALEESKERYDSVKGTKNAAKKIEELSYGVDKLGRNISLTDEDYSEFLSASNELAQAFPELVMRIDENGNSLVNFASSINSATGEVEGFSEQIDALILGARKDLVEKTLEDDYLQTNVLDAYGKEAGKLQNANEMRKSVLGYLDFSDSDVDALSINSIFDLLQNGNFSGIDNDAFLKLNWENLDSQDIVGFIQALGDKNNQVGSLTNWYKWVTSNGQQNLVNSDDITKAKALKRFNTAMHNRVTDDDLKLFGGEDFQSYVKNSGGSITWESLFMALPSFKKRVDTYEQEQEGLVRKYLLSTVRDFIVHSGWDEGLTDTTTEILEKALLAVPAQTYGKVLSADEYKTGLSTRGQALYPILTNPVFKALLDKQKEAKTLGDQEVINRQIIQFLIDNRVPFNTAQAAFGIKKYKVTSDSEKWVYDGLLTQMMEPLGLKITDEDRTLWKNSNLYKFATQLTESQGKLLYNYISQKVVTDISDQDQIELVKRLMKTDMLNSKADKYQAADLYALYKSGFTETISDGKFRIGRFSKENITDFFNEVKVNGKKTRAEIAQTYYYLPQNIREALYEAQNVIIAAGGDTAQIIQEQTDKVDKIIQNGTREALKDFTKFNIKEYFGDIDTNDNKIVDTWEELSSAINKTVDALDKYKNAQKEIASKGKMSWQTVLDLVQQNPSMLKVIDFKTLNFLPNAKKTLAGDMKEVIYTTIKTWIEQLKSELETEEAQAAATKAANDVLSADNATSPEERKIKNLTTSVNNLTKAYEEADEAKAKFWEQKTKDAEGGAPISNGYVAGFRETEDANLASEVVYEDGTTQKIKGGDRRAVPNPGKQKIKTIITRQGSIINVPKDASKKFYYAYNIPDSFLPPDTPDNYNNVDTTVKPDETLTTDQTEENPSGTQSTNQAEENLSETQTTIQRLENLLKDIESGKAVTIEDLLDIFKSGDEDYSRLQKIKDILDTINQEYEEYVSYMAGTTQQEKRDISQNYFAQRRKYLIQEKEELERKMKGFQNINSQEFLGYKKDWIETVNKIHNLDGEEIKYNLEILKIIGDTGAEQIELYKAQVKSANSLKKQLLTQKELNEAEIKYLELKKGIANYEKGIADYQMKYSKGSPYSEDYTLSLQKQTESFKKILAYDYEIAQKTYEGLYNQYITYGMNAENAAELAKTSDPYTKAIQNVYSDMEAVSNAFYEDFQNKSKAIEREITRLQSIKPKKWSVVEYGSGKLKSAIPEINSYYNNIIQQQQKLATESYNVLMQYSKDLTDEQIADLVTKYNNAMTAIRDNNISKLEDTKAYQESVYSALTKTVERNKSQLEQHKKIIDKAYDDEIKKLTDKNTSIERTNKLLELQQNLLNAQKEKERVYREGIGWVLESPRSKIKEARKALDDFYRKDSIDDLNAAKTQEDKVLDERIKNWDDYLEMLKSKYEEFSRLQENHLLQQWLGVESEEKVQEIILNDMKTYAKYRKKHLDGIKNNQIAAFSAYKSTFNDFFSDYTNVLQKLEKAQSRLISLLSFEDFKGDSLYNLVRADREYALQNPEKDLYTDKYGYLDYSKLAKEAFIRGDYQEGIRNLVLREAKMSANDDYNAFDDNTVLLKKWAKEGILPKEVTKVLKDIQNGYSNGQKIANELSIKQLSLTNDSSRALIDATMALPFTINDSAQKSIIQQWKSTEALIKKAQEANTNSQTMAVITQGYIDNFKQQVTNILKGQVTAGELSQAVDIIVNALSTGVKYSGSPASSSSSSKTSSVNLSAYSAGDSYTLGTPQGVANAQQSQNNPGTLVPNSDGTSMYTDPKTKKTYQLNDNSGYAREVYIPNTPIEGRSSGIEGGPITYTGLAMLHGTPTSPEYVLNSDQAYTLLRNISTLQQPQYTIIGEKGDCSNKYIVQGDVVLENCNDPAKFWDDVTRAMNNRFSVTKNR